MIYKKNQQNDIKRTTMRKPAKIGVEPMCSRKVSDLALCVALPVLLVQLATIYLLN